MRKQLLIKAVLYSDGKSDSIYAVKCRIDTFASEDKLVHLLVLAPGRSIKKLLDQAIHVEKLMQLLFRLKDCHDLPNLFTLLHDSTEQ